MTLKTGVMVAKKFSFVITGINYILKYISIENCSFKNKLNFKSILKQKTIFNCNHFSQYYCFTVFLIK